MPEKHPRSRLHACLGSADHLQGSSPSFSTPPSLTSFCSTLKTGGSEISREKWDEADTGEAGEETETPMPVDPSCAPGTYNPVLPDWTRSPLPVGAPHVVMPHAPAVGA
jgi:actin-related protein 10